MSTVIDRTIPVAGYWWTRFVVAAAVLAAAVVVAAVVQLAASAADTILPAHFLVEAAPNLVASMPVAALALEFVASVVTFAASVGRLVVAAAVPVAALVASRRGVAIAVAFELVVGSTGPSTFKEMDKRIGEKTAYENVQNETSRVNETGTYRGLSLLWLELLL